MVDLWAVFEKPVSARFGLFYFMNKYIDQNTLDRLLALMIQRGDAGVTFRNLPEDLNLDASQLDYAIQILIGGSVTYH